VSAASTIEPSGPHDDLSAYEAFLRRAESDANVIGLVLYGSRGFGDYVTEESDVDVIVVVDHDPEAWRTPHGGPVETWPMTLQEFREHAMPGNRDAWNRSAFLGVRVVIDKLDGEIARIVERKRKLTDVEARAIVIASLDDYINALFRSLHNLETGRELEGRLDAMDTLPPLLTTVFALDTRLRPFNKWLRHQIHAQPLSIDGLIPLVEQLLREPTAAVQRTVFRAVETAARRAGYGAEIDSWEPDVAWLRNGT
jgi:Nucleotidyltransferase domain